MKRKVLIVVVGAMSVLLAACGSSSGTDKQDSGGTVENHYFVDGKELSEKEYNQYLSDKENQKEESIIQDNNKTIEEYNNEHKTSKEFDMKELGETIDTDCLNISLDNIEISYGYEFNAQHDNYVKKQPFTPNGGMVLLSLKGKITNIYSKEVQPYFILKSRIIVNDNEYTASLKCFNMQEPKECNTIVPQQTLDYFIYTEIPEDLIGKIENCEIQFGFNQELNNDTIYKDFNDLDYVFSVSGLPK